MNHERHSGRPASRIKVAAIAATLLAAATLGSAALVNAVRDEPDGDRLGANAVVLTQAREWERQRRVQSAVGDAVLDQAREWERQRRLHGADAVLDQAREWERQRRVISG